jgi:hypothetical protein
MVVKGMLEQITTSQVGAAAAMECWVGCGVLGAGCFYSVCCAGAACADLGQGLGAETATCYPGPHGLLRITACLPPTTSALLPTPDRHHHCCRPLPPPACLQVNLVNADLLAKKRGLRIVETVVPAEGTAVLSEIEVGAGGWVGGT